MGVLVIILAVTTANIPAILLQAYNLGFTQANEYAFITTDLYPTPLNTVGLIDTSLFTCMQFSPSVVPWPCPWLDSVYKTVYRYPVCGYGHGAVAAIAT